MITIFTEKYYPDGGGAEVVTYSVVKKLADGKHPLSIITGSRIGESKDPLIKHYHEPLLTPSNKLYLWSISPVVAYKYRELIKVSETIYMPGILYSAIPVIRRINRDARIIVHLHNYQIIKYSQFYVMAKNREEIYSEESYLLLREYGFKGLAILPLIPFIISIIKKYIRYVDVFIAPSKTFKEITCLFIDENTCKRIITVYNPVMKNHYMGRHRLNRIIYAGGDKYIKGYPIALIASLKTHRIRRDVEIVFLGRYRVKPYSGIIRYMGWIPRREAVKLLSSSKTLLFPSIISEPCPMTILEAFSTGTVPVAFDLPTIREFYEQVGLTSYLCKPYDLDCYVDKILELLETDNSILEEEGLRIHLLAIKRFNPDKILNIIEKIITGTG